METFNVSCFFENSSETVEFYAFTKAELTDLFEIKAKGALFVNQDFRGHITAVDTKKITHITAIPR